MKVLLVSPKGDGPWYAWLMHHEGNDVDWFLADPTYKGVFDGIYPAKSYQPSPEKYDLVVFDWTSMGEQADRARTVTPTIGGSKLADRLEEDRLFGLELMEKVGIRVPKWEAFDSPEKGIAWLEKEKVRAVFKPIGDVGDKSTTYVSKDTKDMVAFMERVFKKAKIDKFVLQEVVTGTETAVGGWFNGNEWVVVDHNIEEKKLMSGNIGPNTGCAGMLVWLPRRETPMFQQGLGRVTEFLREQNYVGPLDLNIICTEGTAFGLEWTPRFAYEGTPNLTALLNMPFGEFMAAVARGEMPTLSPSYDQFSATIMVSTPPYPNADKLKKPMIVPVSGVDTNKLERMLLYDVRVVDGRMETTGTYNGIGAPIGLGDTIEAAFTASQRVVESLDIPDKMWRNDVASSIRKRYDKLERQGWFRPIG